jgi:hypothetical protein
MYVLSARVAGCFHHDRGLKMMPVPRAGPAAPPAKLRFKRLISCVPVLFVLMLWGAAAGAWAQTAARLPKTDEGLSVAEFNRLIRDFSEENGYFFSDNFTSNEDSYLTVVDKMRRLGATGGAYVGVGPEQNFTYIAKIHPRIAFIVDIRRQAIIQHLMYKAIFQLAPDRTQFLSRLLSRPAPKEKSPGPGASLNEMLAFFDNVGADAQAYEENLAAVKKAIQNDIQFPLSESDQASLDYVYRSFFKAGFHIGFDIDGAWSRRFGRLPNLKELLAKADPNGKQGNFLASAEDYDFVREMQRKNLIVPVVGDFAGSKALAAVGDYLRKRGWFVSAFYTSNVEMLLFNGDSFASFARNVKRLPINDRTLMIRSVFWYYAHPAQLPGYRLCTLLERASVFLQDFEAGKYPDYRDLLWTHYIAGGEP